MSDDLDLVSLWKTVNVQLKKQGEATDRSLWEAAEAAAPLAVDDDVLVVGLKPADMRLSGYLTTPSKARMIAAIVRTVTGRSLELQVIEGQSAEDWEKYKARHQAQVDRTMDQAQFRSEHKGALGVWETLGAELHRLFTETQQRRFPEQLARLLIRALPVLADAEEKAREAEPESEQLHFTHLNRSFDKLCTYTDIPAPIVALEYMRYRSSRQKRQG
jgi:hypothetical protein